MGRERPGISRLVGDDGIKVLKFRAYRGNPQVPGHLRLGQRPHCSSKRASDGSECGSGKADLGGCAPEAVFCVSPPPYPLAWWSAQASLPECLKRTGCAQELCAPWAGASWVVSKVFYAFRQKSNRRLYLNGTCTCTVYPFMTVLSILFRRKMKNEQECVPFSIQYR